MPETMGAAIILRFQPVFVDFVPVLPAAPGMRTRLFATVTVPGAGKIIRKSSFKKRLDP
jgi:hypothetical protein